MSTTVQLTHSSSDSKNRGTHEEVAGREQETRLMKQDSLNWVEPFRTLFQEKVTAYTNGAQNVAGMFSAEETDFLRSIGATPQEIFDFVEDWCDDGVPDPETVLAITAIRRDYLFREQQGRVSPAPTPLHAFPSPSESLAGLTWFPRIIAKARAKLRGELPPDLMYSCGGDRRFLNKIHRTPVEFLQTVREAGDDIDAIVKFVTERSNS